MCFLVKLTTQSRLLRFLLPGLMTASLSCTAPEVRFLQQAENYGFEQKIVQGGKFKHVVYIKPSASNNDTLHIYLDGDGSPWINNRWVSNNPTPRNTLMLKLMIQDQKTSVYIGRPCYHGFSQVSPCTNKLWTSHRYSLDVVNSMYTAISKVISQYKDRRLVLIGYSGGGTLAMLLAERFSDLHGVITVAANLDIDAWTNYHGYSSLTGSLNPIQRKPVGKEVFQLHLAGAKDTNIPVKQVRSFVERQFSAQLRVFDDYDHHCCWQEIWPSILQFVDTDSTKHNAPVY